MAADEESDSEDVTTLHTWKKNKSKKHKYQSVRNVQDFLSNLNESESDDCWGAKKPTKFDIHHKMPW